MPLPPPLHTLDEVAIYLGLTPRAVRDLIRKHGVPALGTGKRIRFDDLALNALLDALRLQPSPSQQQTAVPSATRGRRQPSSAYQKALDTIAAQLAEAKRQRRERNAANRAIGTGNRHGNVPNGENR